MPRRSFWFTFTEGTYLDSPDMSSFSQIGQPACSVVECPNEVFYTCRGGYSLGRKLGNAAIVRVPKTILVGRDRQCSLACQDIRLRFRSPWFSCSHVGNPTLAEKGHLSRVQWWTRKSLFFLQFLRTSVRRASRQQVLCRQHQLQKRLHGHWYLCIHFLHGH